MADKEPIFVDEHQFFVTVFIREAQIGKNTSSDCISIMATTYDCKILQLYEHAPFALATKLPASSKTYDKSAQDNNAIANFKVYKI